MNTTELVTSLKALRLSGMASVLEMRVLQAHTESSSPTDFLSMLVQDELTRRSDRLLSRRIKEATFRDRGKTLSDFDFSFNRIDKKAIFELATGHFIGRCEDVLFLGPPGTGKSHAAQAIALSAIQQGHRVAYRQAHSLLEELAEAELMGTRKQYMHNITSVPLLVIDDVGMRKLPSNAAEEMLEIIMRRYERASTMLTSNRPIEDWGKMLGDNAAVTALLDRVLHHGNVLKFGPRSFRTANRATLLQQPQS